MENINRCFEEEKNDMYGIVQSERMNSLHHVRMYEYVYARVYEKIPLENWIYMQMTDGFFFNYLPYCNGFNVAIDLQRLLHRCFGSIFGLLNFEIGENSGVAEPGRHHCRFSFVMIAVSFYYSII